MTSCFSTDWAAYTEAKRRANGLNKTIVFDALLEAGITHVSVTFDGEGDQGQIDEPTARANGQSVELPAVTLNIHLTQFGSAENTMSEMNFREAIEQLCYGYLEEGHDGWENNEGSYGEFTLDVGERRVRLDFYGRIIEAAHSKHSF